MDPLGYSWLADALVEPERFAQRQRCANEWNPPGVMRAAGGMSSGGIAFTQIWPARRLKVGIMAVAAGHACDLPHTSPVPRGPNTHLCVPATKKSQPRFAMVASSTP